MNNESRIPDAETRALSVARLRKLVKQMDRHIASLDELNARLEADFQNSLIGAYLKRREKRLATQSQSPKASGSHSSISISTQTTHNPIV